MENEQADQPQTTLDQPMGLGTFLALVVGGLAAIAGAKAVGRALETKSPSTPVSFGAGFAPSTRPGSPPQTTLQQKRADDDIIRHAAWRRNDDERENVQRKIREREITRKR